MSNTHSRETDFISKITGIIEENISNERFGVSELAHESGMSRSNLLRKIKKITKLSASQFIRQVRLKRAMDMLKQTSANVSEVSYRVGFGSTSYFIKCFHDYFGYPPGEVGKREISEGVLPVPEQFNNPLNLWQELKRRKVIRIIPVYAAAAFVLLELVDIISEPFGLPDWTLKLVVVLFSIGFIIAIILSWLYDITPEGVKKTTAQNNTKQQPAEKQSRTMGWKIATYASVVIIVALVIMNMLGTRRNVGDPTVYEKSIAVLPFKNDSNDSTNVYLINGLMEAILNNLQKIEDLRVISRTSVEKYRSVPQIIPEIAKELSVHYFVEGSGQKLGDQILLNIQLIDAKTDKHLWARQYQRETSNIFELQREVAKAIADEIEVIITPEEEERINAQPTSNLVAYDYFLKGLDLLNAPLPEDREEAISYFLRAIEHDNEFARAYADIAITYYLLDEHQADKKYSDQINQYADKALLLDPRLAQSLIAKALYYMTIEDYELAVSYFEKALEYNPNSDLVFAFMVDLYANHYPDTEKYLEYALRGLQIKVGTYDSLTTSFIYLHISSAFVQAGFINEAEDYINKSLDYYPENLYSAYVKPYILYARTGNLQQTKDFLIEALNKDTTRLDIMQEVGKICYFMRDYKAAYQYYLKFVTIKEALSLDIYRSENAKIGVVYSEVGQTEASDTLFNYFRHYAENDPSLYRHINLAMYYSYKGDEKKAIEHLRLFSDQEHFHYWTILFVPIDPLVDNIRDHPEFKKIWNDIETKFWKWHKQIKVSLEEKDLI